MAQLFAVNIYQINSMDAIPLNQVPKIAFPFAGVLIRSIPPTAQLLPNGVSVYSQIQVIATGSVYLAIETPAALVALS